MAIRTHRSRSTRMLKISATQRFHACEVCLKNEAFDAVDDVLASLHLKQRESKRLFANLTCPWCGSEIEQGSLVAAYTRSELAQIALRKKFDVLHARSLADFREFLINFPMLGAEHPFGRMLASSMRRAKKTILEPRFWQRATTPQTKPNFGPRTRPEILRANRFNQIGQVGWYLGCDNRTAMVEVLRAPKTGQPVCIANVHIREAVDVLDLRSVFYGNDGIGHWILRNVVDRRFISEPTSDTDDHRPQYRVPQFVADLARKRNFRGILYDSTRPAAYNNPEAFGYNLVLFDPIPAHAIDEDKVVKFGEGETDLSSLERWPILPQNAVSEAS